jgi:hypothetical protein
MAPFCILTVTIVSGCANLIRIKDGAMGAPSAAMASSAINSTLDVWLVDNMEIESKDLERTEDVIGLFRKLDPKLLVHTTVATKQWKYCPHAFSDPRACVSLNPEAAQAGGRGDSSCFEVDNYGAHLCWGSEGKRTHLGSGAVSGTMKPLEANTPGFILWGTYESDDGPDQTIYFLALDGGVYRIPLDRLALGLPEGSWPSDVQHSLYESELLTGSYAGEAPIALSDELQSEFREAHDKLSACSGEAWRPAQREFDANDAANITERTRSNRAKQIAERYQELGNQKCRPELEEVGGVYAKILDYRLAERQKIYAAAKARFAQ